ncbi:hypothetical protein ACFE04_001298 [Oxalis oulophora]
MHDVLKSFILHPAFLFGAVVGIKYISIMFKMIMLDNGSVPLIFHKLQSLTLFLNGLVDYDVMAKFFQGLQLGLKTLHIKELETLSYDMIFVVDMDESDSMTGSRSKGAKLSIGTREGRKSKFSNFLTSLMAMVFGESGWQSMTDEG